MALGLKPLARSLELRLLAPLAATIGVVLSVHAVLGYWGARDQAAHFVQADLERSRALIESATHDGMLLNRLDEVQARIERLGASPGFTGIRVYGKDGHVSLSADPSERGSVVPIGSDLCRACHVDGATKGSAIRVARNLVDLQNGHEARRSLTLIRNEASCAAVGCHVPPSERAVLGVLDVQMTMAPFDQVIAGVRTQLVWTTAVLILASSVVSGLFIRHLVHAPVKALRDGTRRIAAGDWKTPIEVSGPHEFAELAGAFNGMVAELVAARDELARWSRTLEEKVEAKTIELRQTQQQMSRVETMASLGKLSATVAHELNNPLSGVLTYARLIRRELSEQPLPEDIRAELDGYLELVDKECSRCGAIVKNLLLFARGGGARLTSTDLNQVVEHSLMLIRHHLEMQRIAAESSPLDGDATIVADQGQIQQAVLALLMNAIEAMQGPRDRPGALRVRVSGDADSVELSVSDDGVGIPPEVLPHIYEPFFTTKGERSGVGLGLSVVYGVVHGHGGEIAVQSQPGRGTTFTITLPRRRPETADAARVKDATKESVR
ncbi:MAG: ATP-binding protein [Phycisphaerales bacterium]